MLLRRDDESSYAAGFLEALRDGREIWLEGERVKDVTAHPRLRGAALTIAELYGMQQWDGEP